MIARVVAVLVVAVAALGETGGAAAQEGGRRELARELARVMIDDSVRRGLEERVTGTMTQGMAATLQDRLNRRLQEAEWGLLSEIVGRFVAETFPRSRIEEIAAEGYARHFDEGELRELVRFQQSPVGRKASRLAPVIAMETGQAIDSQLRTSAAIPSMLDALQRAFPVLRPESP
jgi:hypothetical protein